MTTKLRFLISLLGIIVLLYVNMLSEQEYEYSAVVVTFNSQNLENAGYFTITDMFTKPCPICEAIQSGNITYTPGLEDSDNFTIIWR